MAELDFRALWDEALPWTVFFVESIKNYQLWDGVYRHATIPAWASEAAGRSRLRRLLVISEDWCGDAANIVPVLVRLSEAVPTLALRLLPRDKYPAVMNQYLTKGTRSIPIAIGLDAEFHELGHWGPRPSELQAWVVANKDTMPKEQRYAEVRRWYARDMGESTLREVLAAMEAS